MECKHLIKHRQAVGSGTFENNQIVTIICLQCGEILHSKYIDYDNSEIYDTIDNWNLHAEVAKSGKRARLETDTLKSETAKGDTGKCYLPEI